MTSLALSPHLCGAKRGRRSPESDLYCGSKRARGFQACGSSRPYLRERSALQQILSVLPGMDETVRGWPPRAPARLGVGTSPSNLRAHAVRGTGTRPSKLHSAHG